MAAIGFTPIQLFRTTTASATPSAPTLADGELAINLTDEKLYFKNAAGVVKLLADSSGALGSVTSVNVSGGTTGLTTSGGPITSSGTITLAGTLAVANGGTGVTTSTGTGSVVLNTSPTLVTPILGAASATSIANGLGAVGTPSYTFTGDTNTGMWSPAADTVAVSTGGAERLRVDSVGRIGINGSPATNTQLYVRTATITDNAFLADNGVNSGFVVRFASGLTSIGNDFDSPLALLTNNAERMRITSSGSVGIGTSAPSENLTIFGNNPSIGISGGTGSDISPAFTNLSFRGFANHRTALIRSFDQSFSTSPGGGLEFLVNANLGADTLTSAMRIDSSGNVGIGTSSPGMPLDVQSNASALGIRIRGRAADNFGFFQFSSNNLASSASIGSNGSLLQFETNNAERMRIDSSGNLLVGTTTAFAKFAVLGSAYIGSANDLQLGNSGNSNAASINCDSTDTSAAMVFKTAAAGLARTERMRIDSSGNLLVGTTAQLSGERLGVNVAGASSVAVGVRNNAGTGAPTAFFWNAAATGDNVFLHFNTEANGALRGSVTFNRGGGMVAYNITSDYRSKDILGPVADPGATIDALKVYNGKMKGATIARPMLVAHEAQEVVPYAVTGEKDAVNEDGTDKYQQMDHQVLIPLLIAELQSLRARVAQLEGN